MTPDANDPCVFAVKRGDILSRFDVTYALPKYTNLLERIHQSAFFCDTLKDHICVFESGFNYEQSDIESSQTTQLLRTQNVKPIFIYDQNVSYVLTTKVRTLTVENDLLFVRVGAGVGDCAFIGKDQQGMAFSDNVLRVHFDNNIYGPFLAAFLSTNVGKTLLMRQIKGSGKPVISRESIEKQVVPLPNFEQQKQLFKIIEQSHCSYKTKLQNADDDIILARQQILEQVGISFPDYHPSLYSYFRLGQIKEIGLYCNPHSAYLNVIFSKLHNSPFYSGVLEDFVDINPIINKTRLNDSSDVSFVPMPAVSEKTNQVVYEQKEYKDVKTGFTPFQRGDLLWAKITPCMQNGKSFLADSMPTEYGFGSTEFHVLRQKSERIYMPFLWVLLSDEHILEAAQGMFSGSAGQQRVPDTFLKKFPIILPPIEVQKELANEVMKALDQAKRTKETAELEWAEAKAQFEKELLGE